MKKTLLLLFWFIATPLTLVTTLASAYQIKTHTQHIFPKLHPSGQSTAAPSENITSQVKGFSTSVQTSDARPIILAEFLEKHNSPLQPYDYFGRYLTNLSDRYEMDFRLLPAIAMQESNLCKKIPEGTFNCLGLGIHSQGTWGFESYEQNFEAAAKILKQNYIDKGYVTPDEIQDKYTPGSNGSWEYAVNHFMEILETADF